MSSSHHFLFFVANDVISKGHTTTGTKQKRCRLAIGPARNEAEQIEEQVMEQEGERVEADRERCVQMEEEEEEAGEVEEEEEQVEEVKERKERESRWQEEVKARDEKIKALEGRVAADEDQIKQLHHSLEEKQKDVMAWQQESLQHQEVVCCIILIPTTVSL